MFEGYDYQLTNVTCPECGAALPKPPSGDKTACLECGHEWELTSGHHAIKSATLEVQNAVTYLRQFFDTKGE